MKHLENQMEHSQVGCALGSDELQKQCDKARLNWRLDEERRKKKDEVRKSVE